MLVHGNPVEQLALEGQAGGKRIGADVAEQAIEIAASVPDPASEVIEGNTGNGEQIEFSGLNAFLRDRPQILAGLRNTERPRGKICQIRKEKQP